LKAFSDMSSSSNQGKKVIRTADKTVAKGRTTRKSGASAVGTPLLFDRRHYIIMGIGVLLIALGMLLMSGGAMPSPDVWDESLIYSARRTVLAPIVILAGLGMQIYAIFKR
jgi:hypothetical protein